MKKNNRCIVLLYFENGYHDFLIFNNRAMCSKYFNNENNLNCLEKRGLSGYKIVFGIIQEEY